MFQVTNVTTRIFETLTYVILRKKGEYIFFLKIIILENSRLQNKLIKSFSLNFQNSKS